MMAYSTEGLTDLYLKEKPSEIDLDEIYKGVGVRWRSLLTHLGLPLAKIKSLQEESRGDPSATCFHGLVFWRDGNEPCRPATWEVLLEALDKGAEMKEYASELKEKVCAKRGVQRHYNNSRRSLTLRTDKEFRDLELRNASSLQIEELRRNNITLQQEILQKDDLIKSLKGKVVEYRQKLHTKQGELLCALNRIKELEEKDKNGLVTESQRQSSTDMTATLESSIADPLTSGNMDKGTEWIMEGDMSSMEEKSDSPDEETSNEELTPKGTTITYIEIDLEAIEKVKEMYGIDLKEIDLDVVESHPRLDSSMQRSKAMAVNQEVFTRRLPTKVAIKLGTIYPQHRKDLMKLTEDRHRYTTQQSAPMDHSRKESDEDVRTRLGIGRGNPLAGQASVMKGGLLKKSSQSSPGSARKKSVTPPAVALKPTKKPIKAPPVKSISVDPQLTSHTKEEVKTSTPKPGEKPPEPETPPESKPPTKNVSSSQRSVRSDNSDLSTLFPKANSHLFDDEISQWFVKADGDLKTTAEEKENIPPVEEKKETPTKKPPVKGSKPAIPEWKKSLQERKTLKKKETASPVTETKERPVPEKMDLFGQKDRTALEPAPLTVLSKEPQPASEVKESEPDLDKKSELEPEIKSKPVPEKKAKPVPEKKQDACTEQLPAGSEKTKKGDKKRLEERRAARTKEMEDMGSSAKPKNVADWKTRKSDSVPEKKPEVVIAWKKKLAERNRERETTAKSEQSTTKSTTQPEQRKPLFDESLLKESAKLEQKPRWFLFQLNKSASVKNDVEEVVKQKVVETVEEMPPSTDKTVGGVANKEEISTDPEAPASDKKGDEKIPEWKKTLEERRAARTKERENIQSSTEAKKVPDWKSRKTKESKATKESGKKTPAVTSTDSVPEWKKQLEERRKQRELEKAQQLAEKSREHSRNVEDDIPAWKKKLAERKGKRETPAKSEPSTTKSTTQPEQRKPLFDESLLKESAKLEQKTTSKEESKEKKKATIDSLFDEDDDVLFKSAMSSPISVMEPAKMKGESPVTLDSGDPPSPDIVIPEGQESNIVSDWVVVDDEAVKQANEDIAATGKKEPSIKDEEQVSDKKTSPLLSDRKSSTLPVRKTPSPMMKGSPKQFDDVAGSPSWLDRATKMREANLSKYTRSQTYSQVCNTKEDEEMPSWKKRVLERKKEKELASSRNHSSITKPREASSSTPKSSGNESVKSEKTEVAKTSSPIATRESQKPTTEDDVFDWQQRLAERRKAQEMEREKKLVSTTKKAEVKTSKEKPSPKEPAQEESKKATSSLFDDQDDDLPSWKSKLASRKKQLEKRKDELGVPISVTASKRAQSEPPHADEQETSEPLATKQKFTSLDNLMSATGSQKMAGSRISSVSSVDEVFSASENTQDTEKTSSKTSLSPTRGEEVRKSPSPHSSTEPISAEEETPSQGYVRRTSVKFSSEELDDDLPQWKKKLLERKKSGRKELGSGSNTSIESKKEEGVPEFLKEFQRKQANSQARTVKGI